ncbi:unnamed protein product [Parajaminaea phylloscopi]
MPPLLSSRFQEALSLRTPEDYKPVQLVIRLSRESCSSALSHFGADTKLFHLQVGVPDLPAPAEPLPEGVRLLIERDLELDLREPCEPDAVVLPAEIAARWPAFNFFVTLFGAIGWPCSWMLRQQDGDQCLCCTNSAAPLPDMAPTLLSWIRSLTSAGSIPGVELLVTLTHGMPATSLHRQDKAHTLERLVDEMPRHLLSVAPAFTSTPESVKVDCHDAFCRFFHDRCDVTGRDIPSIALPRPSGWLPWPVYETVLGLFAVRWGEGASLAPRLQTLSHDLERHFSGRTPAIRPRSPFGTTKICSQLYDLWEADSAWLLVDPIGDDVAAFCTDRLPTSYMIWALGKQLRAHSHANWPPLAVAWVRARCQDLWPAVTLECLAGAARIRPLFGTNEGIFRSLASQDLRTRVVQAASGLLGQCAAGPTPMAPEDTSWKDYWDLKHLVGPTSDQQSWERCRAAAVAWTLSRSLACLEARDSPEPRAALERLSGQLLGSSPRWTLESFRRCDQRAALTAYRAILPLLLSRMEAQKVV